MRIEMPKESQYTPLLIGVCNQDAALLCADSRTTFYDGESFETDDSCKKIFKINENLLFGASGIFNENDRLIEPFVGKDCGKITFDCAIDIINDYLIGEIAIDHGLTDRNYILAGKNKYGKYSLAHVSYNSFENQIETTQQIGDSHGCYILMLPPNGWNDIDHWKEQFENSLSGRDKSIIVRIVDYVYELMNVSNLVGGKVKCICAGNFLNNDD